MTWLQKLFWGEERSLKEEVKPRLPFPTGYTLETWHASGMPGAAKALFGEETFRHIYAVLYNSIPSGYPGRGVVVNDTTANIELGRIQGYLDCLNLLQSLAIPRAKNEEAEIDWNAEVPT